MPTNQTNQLEFMQELDNCIIDKTELTAFIVGIDWNLFLFTRYFPLHRFSEETTTGKDCSQRINWSELVNAAEAAEKRLGKKTTLHCLFS